MKEWALFKLTQASAWIGAFLILAMILHLPHWVFFTAGVALILVDDAQIEGAAKKLAPGVVSWLKELDL